MRGGSLKSRLGDLKVKWSKADYAENFWDDRRSTRRSRSTLSEVRGLPNFYAWVQLLPFQQPPAQRPKQNPWTPPEYALFKTFQLPSIQAEGRRGLLGLCGWQLPKRSFVESPSLPSADLQRRDERGRVSELIGQWAWLGLPLYDCKKW